MAGRTLFCLPSTEHYGRSYLIRSIYPSHMNITDITHISAYIQYMEHRYMSPSINYEWQSVEHRIDGCCERGCQGNRGKIGSWDGQMVGHNALPWYPSLALPETPVSEHPSIDLIPSFFALRDWRVALALHESTRSMAPLISLWPLCQIRHNHSLSLQTLLFRLAFWPRPIRMDHPRMMALYCCMYIALM